MDLYFRLMGCVTWTIAIIAGVMQIVWFIKNIRFSDGKAAFMNVLNFLAIALLGSGLGMLFMEYGRSLA